ncbi:S1C family serine protease [Thermoflavimicrobium dichotomicum]|uniref:Serine protease Do n=1 Tax=Thermoflavimicrobium dichotomicum TaxID=46223 RepID=A0A1I3MGQ0_9BACL|nr:trypsin-like peptidase domain-containing protein [Thermoflavimicrobium dichotomicum]SFI96158.1 serine protease Do [Thermoflavimicrobium dichotomicum]
MNGRKMRLRTKNYTAASHPVNHFVSVVRQVRDGVVSLLTQKSPQPHFFHETIWSQLFSNQKSPAIRQFGSGFVVHPAGYILTNEHVIADVDTIAVKVSGYDQLFPAKIAWSDPKSDLAIIRIYPPNRLKALPLGTSTTLEVGEWVIAMGNPFGLEQTVTVGVVSGKNRPLQVGDRTYQSVIQTDAAINPGNSGGPLINMLGKVIGINTFVIYPSQSIGFAIPIENVKPILAKL